jgi:hypothetical protein
MYRISNIFALMTIGHRLCKVAMHVVGDSQDFNTNEYSLEDRTRSISCLRNAKIVGSYADGAAGDIVMCVID